MDNRKSDFHCTQEEAERFVSTLGNMESCELKDFKPVNDKCHNVIYKYLVSGERVSIVYDTKAKLLSMTAPASAINRLEKIWKHAKSGSDAGSAKTGVSVGTTAYEKETDNRVNKNRQNKPGREEAVFDAKSASPVRNKQAGNEDKSTQPAYRVQKLKFKNNPQTSVSGKPSSPGRAVKRAKAEKQPTEASTEHKTAAKQNETNELPKTLPVQPAATEPESTSVTVKKVTGQRFDEILKGLKKIKGVSCRLESTVAQGKPDETKVYLIRDNKNQRVKLRFMLGKGILQLQGKRSNLFGEVQVQLNKGDDYNSAVKNYIAIAGEDKKAGDVQKMLKKRLPDAYEYLSEQSKIDITIGLIDIYNNETRLTDYSSLLTPPYRGLEKFISDLQKAQGIEVKMIGQAYDKPDGKYVLKSGYIKRIKSVVYAEVMAALYTEYFARRNFYTHSDNSDDSSPRMITDKNEVLTIFDRLLDTINYNCKKLKEIGFSIR